MYEYDAVIACRFWFLGLPKTKKSRKRTLRNRNKNMVNTQLKSMCFEMVRFLLVGNIHKVNLNA